MSTGCQELAAARTALREAARRLAAAGVRSPAFDAALLLRTAAGWSAAELEARLLEPLPEAANEAFRRLVRERAARRPLQHLTGTVEFFELTLAVGPEALVPRPDTETLVEAALARLSPKTPTARTPTGKTPTPLLVADVGCGSGAVALALASRLPAARILAVDNAAPALALAARNVRETGFGERVRVVGGDLLTAVGDRALDAVAANLPYIPDGEIAGLDPEVRDHEPRSALAGGPDGLDPLRRLASGAARALREGGELFVEIGAGQRRAATAILEAAGFGPVAVSFDLAGTPRVLAAPLRPAARSAQDTGPPAAR